MRDGELFQGQAATRAGVAWIEGRAPRGREKVSAMNGTDIAEQLHAAGKMLGRAADRAEEGEWLAALRVADTFQRLFTDAIAEVVQHAYNAGHTKTAIAQALGVPVSTLRGMGRTVQT